MSPSLAFSSKFLIKSLGKSLASNAEPIKEVSNLPASSTSSHDWKTSSVCEISREHTAVSSVTAPVTSWVIYTADGGGKKKTQLSEQNPSLKDTAVLERDGKTKRKREVRSRRLQGWNRYADLWIQRGKDRLGRTERNSDIYIYIYPTCVKYRARLGSFSIT